MLAETQRYAQGILPLYVYNIITPLDCVSMFVYYDFVCPRVRDEEGILILLLLILGWSNDDRSFLSWS